MEQQNSEKDYDKKMMRNIFINTSRKESYLLEQTLFATIIIVLLTFILILVLFTVILNIYNNQLSYNNKIDLMLSKQYVNDVTGKVVTDKKKQGISSSSTILQGRKEWNYYKSKEDFEAVESAKAYARQQYEMNIQRSLNRIKKQY